MAQRYGGKFSPQGNKTQPNTPAGPYSTATVDPVGARANLMFLPAIALLFTALFKAALPMAFGLAGAGVLCLGAWLLRGGLQAEAAFNSRKIARRPALPRKLLAAVLAGAGTGLATFSHGGGPVSALLFGVAVLGLHIAAFGADPLKSKGMEGVDTFQQDRVARVVDEAEKHLAGMTDAMKRANDRTLMSRLEQFQSAARTLIRTVEDDPRDLTAARKYLGVYLQGARDATIKFADIYARNRDVDARLSYVTLLDDLERNFAARTEKLLLDDNSDLTIEIEVLQDRLKREGVRLD
jgi:hypothetical protein